MTYWILVWECWAKLCETHKQRFHNKKGERKKKNPLLMSDFYFRHDQALELLEEEEVQVFAEDSK